LDRLIQTVANADLRGILRGGDVAGDLGNIVQGLRGGSPSTTATAPEESYAPMYFPGSIDPETAATVKLAAAAEIRGIDFTLKPVRTVTVRGRVIASEVPPATAQQQPPPAPQGQGQRGNRGGGGGGGRGGRGGDILQALGNGRGGAQVLLLRSGTGGGRGEIGQNRAAVGADGTFQIANVIPGSYNVVALQPGASQVLSAVAKVEVGGADVDNVTLALRPGISVSGQIYIDGAAPPQNFRMEQVRVTLNAVEDVPLGNSNTQVKADGTFVLNNVAPMTYRINVGGLGSGGYLAAARYGSADALTDLLQPGDQSLPLSLQIGFAPGRVEGTVVDGRDQPFPGVNCVLVPSARKRTELYRTASTDQYGRCAFANVIPGDYKIFAWEDIPQGAYMDAAYISRFEDRGLVARVEKNGLVSTQIRVIPSENR
jgi:hypothetical protein